MLIENQHPHNKSIMVSVLGLPNVGKSSLINYLLGYDLSIVTHKPQTTRNRFHCVFTVDRTEIILVDTPGLHRSNQEFNKRMNEQARNGANGSDLNLLLIDLSMETLKQFTDFNGAFRESLSKTWVIFTKSDKVENADRLPLDLVIEKAKSIIPSIENCFIVSSKTGDNMHKLIGAICDEAQEGPHLYLNGQMSNKNMRFFVTEYIREQAFLLLREELPYQIAVVIDEYKNIKTNQMAHISASILVNRPSQRAIVIGPKGELIKEIGIRSRQKIEEMTGHQVFLNLHVKVVPRWFKNNFVLQEIGLPRSKDSNRVWRSGC